MKVLALQLLLTLVGYTPHVVNRPFRVEERRDTTDNIVVIHYDSGSSLTSTLSYLRRHGNAYHYVINKDGTIFKLIDPTWEGRHAGLSYFHGHIRINHYSIGVCLRGNGVQPFTVAQYKSLAWLLLRLKSRYPDIDSTKIVGHSDVATPFGRKKDPGPLFDWGLLYKLMNGPAA